MSSIGTGYDLSASQFSPDGRIFQIEYAQKAVENSPIVLGLTCKDGVVLGVEKPFISALHEETSNTRIFNIDYHIGIAVAGLSADSKALVEIARDEAMNYRENFGLPAPIKHIVDYLSMYIHAHTLYSAFRPFCSILLVSSMTKENGGELYLIEPSGVSYKYFACVAGKTKQAAKTEIEKINFSQLTVKESVKEVAKIILNVHGEIKEKTDCVLNYLGLV